MKVAFWIAYGLIVGYFALSAICACILGTLRDRQREEARGRAFRGQGSKE